MEGIGDIRTREESGHGAAIQVGFFAVQQTLGEDPSVSPASKLRGQQRGGTFSNTQPGRALPPC